MLLGALLHPVAWKNVLQRGPARGNDKGDKPKLESYPKNYCKKLAKQDSKSHKIEYSDIVSLQEEKSRCIEIHVQARNDDSAKAKVRKRFKSLYGKIYDMDEIVEYRFVGRFGKYASQFSFKVSYYKKILG